MLEIACQLLQTGERGLKSAVYPSGYHPSWNRSSLKKTSSIGNVQDSQLFGAEYIFSVNQMHKRWLSGIFGRRAEH